MSDNANHPSHYTDHCSVECIGAIERGEIDEHEAWLEMREAEAEYQLAQEMQEHFDMNGDPYMDFEGNPW